VPDSVGFSLESSGFPPDSVGFTLGFSGFPTEPIGFPSREKQIDEKELTLSIRSRENKKINKNAMEAIILNLCALRPQTIEKLGKLLDRNPDFLRNSYIKPLIKNGKIKQL